MGDDDRPWVIKFAGDVSVDKIFDVIEKAAALNQRLVRIDVEPGEYFGLESREAVERKASDEGVELDIFELEE